MFKIDIKYDDKNPQGFLSVYARIMDFKKRIPDEISRKLLEFGINAQATSKKDYLSNHSETTLGVVTGRLRSSIALTFKKEENISEVSIGTNVKYGVVHEKGFTGTVSIPSFSRRVRSRDIRGFVGEKKRILNKGTGIVRAHTRKLDIKARPFLRPAVENNLPWLKQNLFGLGGSYGK